MRFEKVSFIEFRRHFPDGYDGYKEAKEAYEQIKLPQRATSGSAGYDFYLPQNLCIAGGCSHVATIPTGVRVWLDPGCFLMCVPRSGLGFKHGLRLKNTTGIIDEDFVMGESEGHILAAITTDSPVSLHAGDRFMQGIIVKYGVTEDDCPMNDKRTGGVGSTGGAG